MPKNKALQDALKKAGVTKDTFAQERLLKPKKKKSVSSDSWKVEAKLSEKLCKAKNQAQVNRNKAAKKGKKKKIKKKIKMPAYIDGGHLELVYGGGKKAKVKSKIGTKKIKQKISCRLPVPLVRSPVFENMPENQAKLLPVSESSVWQSESRNTDSHNIIMIGLDFGTSSTKVVIQDVARRAYAVPFTDANENPYLIPAKVYEHRGVFSLEPLQTVYRDLKLILIQDRVELVTLVPAVAYMSLIIRHCQGWLWDNHRDTYARDEMIWGVNLGLPAASYENNQLVERFLTMAIAARELAGSGQREMSKDNVFAAIETAYREVRETKQVSNDLGSAIKIKHPVSVFPEIAAQVFGFVMSSSWDSRDRPMMMMVDIGAGTVDASIFSVVEQRKVRRSFNFFGNNVRGNGVMNLHRERLKWLRRLITDNDQWSDDIEQYFCDIEIPTDRLMPIPETVIDYIPGMEIKLSGNKSIDDQFYDRYSTQLYSDTILKVQGTKISSTMQWRYLPFFLCGGGRNMEFYKRFAKSINKSTSATISLDVLEIPKPEKLEAKGLRSNEFHRLSVAYGLSFDDIGDFVKPENIPDISRAEKKTTWQDNYVSKDQV